MKKNPENLERFHLHGRILYIDQKKTIPENLLLKPGEILDHPWNFVTPE